MEQDKQPEQNSRAKSRAWHTGILAFEMTLLSLGGIKYGADQLRYGQQQADYQARLLALQDKAGPEGQINVQFTALTAPDGSGSARNNSRMLEFSEASQILIEKPAEPEIPFTNQGVLWTAFAIGAGIVLGKRKLDENFREKQALFERDRAKEQGFRDVVDGKATLALTTLDGQKLENIHPRMVPSAAAARQMAYKRAMDYHSVNESMGRKVTDYTLRHLWPFD